MIFRTIKPAGQKAGGFCFDCVSSSGGHRHPRRGANPLRFTGHRFGFSGRNKFQSKKTLGFCEAVIGSRISCGMTASSCRETAPLPSSLPGLTHCCPVKPHEPFLARFCTLPPLHPCGGDVSVRRQGGKSLSNLKVLGVWRRSSPPLSAIADISPARGRRQQAAAFVSCPGD